MCSLGDIKGVATLPSNRARVAYRAFLVEDGVVDSVYMTHYWQTGKNTADRKPTTRNLSGFWGCSTVSAAQGHGNAVGRVCAYGKVVLHKQGLRAEHMRVTAIVSGGIMGQKAARLLGIPYIPYKGGKRG